MCGIAGYCGSFAPEGLARANRLQAHRGPDGEGTWFDSDAGVGLAHRRLSIIDLSTAGSQPMLSEDGSAVLILNGEIYNYRELRSELEARGHRFRGHSDTEVLLRLYLEEGEKALARLNGMFAFAVWDKRNRSLFLARDALGVKPLYYSATAAGFAFASEIKALLGLAPVAPKLDIPALHRYLTFLWCPGEGTPLLGVRKLPPGEAMIVREGRIARRWSWYRLPIFDGGTSELSESEALSGTVHTLRQAVHRQMVADVPVGAFLSGGLDSSAIVAFAREQAPDIRCFTIESASGPDAGVVDDLPYAKRVAAHLGVSLDVVSIDAGRMAADVEDMVTQLDEPLADPAPLNVLYISRLAREHGIKVLLSGAGGDDLFAGYRRHAAVNYEGYWEWLPQHLRRAIANASGGLDQRRPLFRRLTRLLKGAGLAGDASLADYFAWSGESDLVELYTSDFLAGLRGEQASGPLIEFLKPLPGSVPRLERMLALEQRFFLCDHNLVYTDKMSMATGVEVRVPFLDTDLVERAARVPARFKQRGRTGKWILKRALEPYLPRETIYRPKSGFGAPLRRWMRNELRPLMNDLLSPQSLKRRGLFDPAAVQRLVGRNDSGGVDAAYLLLSLMCIEIWCRHYIDPAAERHVGFG